MATEANGTTVAGANDGNGTTPDMCPSPELAKIQDRVVILTGLSNPQLGEDVGREFDKIIGTTTPTIVQHPVGIFDKSGERHVNIETSVLGKDVLIVQPTAYNADDGVGVNDAVLEALLMIDAAKEAGAKRVILAAANYGYARQDRISLGVREPNSASLLARLYKTAGADIMLTIDLHQEATTGAFGQQWINLYGWHFFIPVLDQEIPQPRLVVGPDAGSAKRTDMYAKRLLADKALAHKRRNLRVPNDTETGGLMGPAGGIEGMNAIVVDDIGAGGKTFMDTVDLVAKRGVASVVGVLTHAQLYGDDINQ
jgi:ribose-phosphate pyrophosphokinase